MNIKVYVVKGIVTVVYKGNRTTYPLGCSIRQAVETAVGGV